MRIAVLCFTAADNGLDNWLCITLVVASEGKFTLPKINTQADVRKALTALASTSPETILAFELLWTPQVYAPALYSCCIHA